MTLVRALFDGLALASGDAITTGNSASPDAFQNVVGTGITYDTSHPDQGAGGVRFAAAASTSTYVEFSSVAGASNACAVEFSLYFDSLSTASQPLVYFRSSSGGTGLFVLQINASGQLFVTSDAAGGANQGTATAGLSTGTLYRVSVQATNGTSTTGSITVNVYAPPSSTTPVTGAGLSLSSINLGVNAIGCFRFGRPAAIGTAWTLFMDTLVAQTGSSTAIGYYREATVSADASGSGTLTAAAIAVSTATAALTGSGTLTAALTAKRTVAAAASGSGALSTSLTLAFTTNAGLSGDGTLSATAQITLQTAGADFTGDGALSAEAIPIAQLRFFYPPYVQRRVPLAADSALVALMNFGLAVYRVNGQWFESEYPPPSAFTDADLFFEGGHEHLVDADTAALLNAAGYDIIEVFS